MKKIKFIEITNAEIVKFIPLDEIEYVLMVNDEIRKVADWMLSNGMFKETGNSYLMDKIIDAASFYYKGCYLIYNFEKNYNIEGFYSIDFNDYINS